MQKVNMQNANIKNARFDSAYLNLADFSGATVNEKTSFRLAACVFTDFCNILNLDAANFTSAILHLCKMSSPVSEKIRKQAVSIVGILIGK